MKFGSIIASLALAAASGGAMAQQILPPPLPYFQAKELMANSQAWQRFMAEHQPRSSAPPAGPRLSPAWTPLKNFLPQGLGASNPLLLTDGTVLVHVGCTNVWFKLTPDIDGSYVNGTWSRISDMPRDYNPLYFASAVLPDGRVIAEGGEYNYNGNTCAESLTNFGDIYDPVTDSWKKVDPPAGWKGIADASSTLLADGTYLLANALTTESALLDAAALTWTATGAGKFDPNDEENWTLLPDGNVLTIDAFTNQPKRCSPHSEGYVPKTGSWVSAGSTVVTLSDCSGSIETFEAPTQILQPGGKVFAFGANTSTGKQNFPVHSAVYDTGTSTWAQGPDLPELGIVNYSMVDAPAAILTNGNVLVAVSPTTWQDKDAYPNPTHFYIFDGSNFTRIGDFDDSPNLSSYQVNFLVLPTGQVLGVETNLPRMQVLPVQGKANSAWLPVVQKLSSKALKAGQSYSVTGKQLSGLTYGAVYGDDVQASTNFPLVRIVNSKTKHVFYARTTFSSASVEPGTVSTAKFTVPAGIETGASSLYVVANGIASKPVAVTVS